MRDFADAVIRGHREFTLDRLSHFGPSLGLALLFASAAIVSFAPSRPRDFVRTLLHLGGATIVGVFVMAFVSGIFDLGPRTYTSDPHALLRLAIVGAFPVFTATILILRPIPHGG